MPIEEGSTISHLSAAMATTEDDTTQTTSSPLSDATFYIYCTHLVIGVVGTVGNALTLYALIASKQHKKHAMIVNQNAIDLFCSFFLIVTSVVRLSNVRLTGMPGYWLCITILSNILVAWGVYGSRINIALIAIERYLKFVYPEWSKKVLRPWVTYSAMAFAWCVGVVILTPLVFKTTAVIDGECWAFRLYSSHDAKVAVRIFILSLFYVTILVVLFFCYWRILVAVRRQARVMAGHNAAGSSISSAQIVSINYVESNVIKTMVLVAAFYALCNVPHGTLKIVQMSFPNLKIPYSFQPLTRITPYLYIIMNPFIYAIKFDPVKQILRGMIPSCNRPV